MFCDKSIAPFYWLSGKVLLKQCILSDGGRAQYSGLSQGGRETKSSMVSHITTAGPMSLGLLPLIATASDNIEDDVRQE